jgi:hypothetical protein
MLSTRTAWVSARNIRTELVQGQPRNGESGIWSGLEVRVWAR